MTRRDRCLPRATGTARAAAVGAAPAERAGVPAGAGFRAAARVLAVLLLGVPFVTAGAPVWAQGDDSGFAEAVEAYHQRDHDQALALFAALAEAEPDPARRAVLHFDAGTAAARAGASGEAVWHLDAALRFDPGLREAAMNLAQVRAELGTVETEETQFTSALQRLPLRWTPQESERIVAGLVGLALLLLALWRLGAGGTPAVVGGVIALLAAGGWWLATDQARAHDLQRAIVVTDRASVLNEPDGAEVLGRLQQGTELRFEAERRGWRLVETGQGARGWVAADQVRPVARHAEGP